MCGSCFEQFCQGLLEQPKEPRLGPKSGPRKRWTKQILEVRKESDLSCCITFLCLSVDFFFFLIDFWHLLAKLQPAATLKSEVWLFDFQTSRTWLFLGSQQIELEKHPIVGTSCWTLDPRKFKGALCQIFVRSQPYGGSDAWCLPSRGFYHTTAIWSFEEFYKGLGANNIQ